jgi:hypothetical protein
MRGAQLTVTKAGGAAGAASATLHLLSRYPTRTAPTVPGHVHTRLRLLSAATSRPGAAGELLPRTGLDQMTGPVWPRVGSPQAASQGVIAAEVVGGPGRWRR